METNPRRYLVRMFIFLLGVFIIAALLGVVFSYRRLDRFAESNSGLVSEAAGEAGGESK